MASGNVGKGDMREYQGRIKSDFMCEMRDKRAWLWCVGRGDGNGGEGDCKLR